MLEREDYELIKKVEYFLRKQSENESNSGGTLWTWALKVPHEERLEVFSNAADVIDLSESTFLHFEDRAIKLIKKLPPALLRLSVKNLAGQFLKVMQEILTQYFKNQK